MNELTIHSVKFGLIIFFTDLLFSFSLNFSLGVATTFLIEDIIQIEINGFAAIVWIIFYSILAVQFFINVIIAIIGEQKFKSRKFRKLTKKTNIFIFTNITYIVFIFVGVFILSNGIKTFLLYLVIPLFIAWVLFYKRVFYIIYSRKIYSFMKINQETSKYLTKK